MRSHSEKNSPPITVSILYEICMASILDVIL
jgi:hypothetical protein